MADSTFHLEIITPEKILVSDEVDSVEVPGAYGEFQVLAGHTPFLTSLKTGSVTLIKGIKKSYLSISGGYFEVMPEKATILAQTAESADEIDNARAEAAQKRAQKRIDDEQNDESIDVNRAKLALMRAINRISVAEMK